MKKYIPLLLFLVTVGYYIVLSYSKFEIYNDVFFDLLQSILLWLVSFLFLSIFSAVLSDKKYKIYLLITLVYSLITLGISYGVGDHGGWAISFSQSVVVLWYISAYSFISLIYFIVQYFKKDKNIIK